MKSIITLLAAIAVLCAVPSVTFAGGGKSKKGTHGKVTAVTSMSITLSSKKSGEPKTFKIDSSTAVTIDGHSGKHASDIKVGMKASITTASNPDTAASITATSKGKGKKAKPTS